MNCKCTLSYDPGWQAIKLNYTKRIFEQYDGAVDEHTYDLAAEIYRLQKRVEKLKQMKEK